VFAVLEAHGYVKSDVDQHVGRAIGVLSDLVEAYEGQAS
jgi:hypothetical protein